jgi:hypothetical protein
VSPESGEVNTELTGIAESSSTGLTELTERVSGISCVRHRMRSLYAPQTESREPSAEVLAPIPAEILDQLIREDR